MRAAFFALLLVNLLFLAWAEWIDVPVLPANTVLGLPRLRLAAGAHSSGPHDFAARPSGVPAASANAASGQGTDVAGSSGHPAATSRPADAAIAARCVSVGPFESTSDAKHASRLLDGLSLPAQQRVAQSQPTRWYWVYLPGPDSASRMRRELRRLRADGIDGVEPMSVAGKQSISLGMFQDRKLAVRQQRLAQRNGFHPMFAERMISQPVYWLDLWVTGGAHALPLRALKAGTGTVIGTQPCPAGETPPHGPPRAVSPGLPAPQAKVSVASPGP